MIEFFDSPLPAPTPEKSFPRLAGPYITGPVPAHLKSQNVTGLAKSLTRLPEGEAAALVEFGSLWLDNRPCLDPARSLARHSVFRFNPPAYGPVKFYEANPNRVVFEDRDLLIYNKESGRPSQAVPHDAYNNILSALERLLAKRGDASSRLWLSHRLDADTSGLLLMAKNKETASYMGKAFQEGRVTKSYLCLGLGQAPEKNVFTAEVPIAKEGRRYVVKPGGPGLNSRTDFKVLEIQDGSPWKQVLFQASPLTGRTHQIRLHLAWAGWPIAGDNLYGRQDEGSQPAARLMLTSAQLAFVHPRTGAQICLNHPARS